MGRQPNAPKQTRNGTYQCWHPGVKKYVNLGTQDFDVAQAIQAGFYGRKSLQSHAAPTILPSVGDPTVPYPQSRDQGADVIDFDKPDASADPHSFFSRMSGKEPEPSAPMQAQTVFSGQTVFAPAPFQPIKPPVTGSKAKPGLTPEQSAKLASGLKKTVANLNVIIVGAGVQMFGRVPAPLDDEEVALLQMGWEMYIDELFAKSKIKPWHLLFAGNVMIATAMYVGGTPIPKKQLPPGDGTKAKSGTVTPIDGGK